MSKPCRVDLRYPQKRAVLFYVAVIYSLFTVHRAGDLETELDKLPASQLLLKG